MYFVFCIWNTFQKCILYLYLKYILMYLYFIFQAKNAKYILMWKYDVTALISISTCSAVSLDFCQGRLSPPKTRTQTSPLFGLEGGPLPPKKTPGRRLPRPSPLHFLLPGCNNACLLAFSLKFSRKYYLVLTFAQYQTLYCCCYSLTHRALPNTVAILKTVFFSAADIRCEVMGSIPVQFSCLSAKLRFGWRKKEKGIIIMTNTLVFIIVMD